MGATSSIFASTPLLHDFQEIGKVLNGATSEKLNAIVVLKYISVKRRRCTVCMAGMATGAADILDSSTTQPRPHTDKSWSSAAAAAAVVAAGNILGFNGALDRMVNKRAQS